MLSILVFLTLQASPVLPVAPPTAVATPQYNPILKAWVYPADREGYQWVVPGRGSVYSLWAPPKYEKIFR